MCACVTEASQTIASYFGADVLPQLQGKRHVWRFNRRCKVLGYPLPQDGGGHILERVLLRQVQNEGPHGGVMDGSEDGPMSQGERTKFLSALGTRAMRRGIEGPRGPFVPQRSHTIAFLGAHFI